MMLLTQMEPQRTCEANDLGVFSHGSLKVMSDIIIVHEFFSRHLFSTTYTELPALHVPSLRAPHSPEICKLILEILKFAEIKKTVTYRMVCQMRRTELE